MKSNKRSKVDEKIEKKVVRTMGSSTTGNTYGNWWTESDPYSSVFSTIDRLVSYQNTRHVNNLRYAWLYQHQNLIAFRPGTNYGTGGSYPLSPDKMTYNVINSCVQTAAAKIVKDDIRVTFLTNNGNPKQQRKAKNLTKFITGLFSAAKTYEESYKVFIDAAVFGTGFMHIYDDGANIFTERVMVDELLVDEIEAVSGQPRQMHRRKLVDKHQLAASFPEHADAIMGASTQITVRADTVSDLVLVVESWHLPNKTINENNEEILSDGRHTICVNSCTLYDEEYSKDYFPFVKYCWDEPLDGFYGIGITHKIMGIQVEISRLLKSIQQAMHHMAVPRILVEETSQVNVGHLSNLIDGAVIKYSGTPPNFWVPGQVMSNDVYSHVENLYKKAFEMIGLSQMSATSQKPGGLDSGVALREYHNIETERFILNGKRWEQFFVSMASICVDLARDLYKDGKSLSYRVNGRGFIKEVDFSDCNLKEDQYIIQSFPTSILPTTPAGRLAIVQELIQAGFISQEFGLSLLRFPDIDQYTNLQTANVDASFEQVSRILEDGEVLEPLPFQDLNLLLKIAQLTAVRAYVTPGIDQDNLELLYSFIETVQNLLLPPPAPAPMPAPAPPAEAVGVPQANPVSELLPFKQ